MRLLATFKGIVLGICVLAAIAMAGCGGGDGGGGGSEDPTIRFYNGCSDSTLLNFLLDDAVVGPQLAYLQSTPDFADEDPETRDLRIQEDGSSVDIWSEVVTLAKDRDYLVTAIGIKNFGTENLKRLRFLFTQVDRNAPNGSRAKLLIVHGYNRAAGFDTPTVDFQTPGDNPQFKSEDIGYGTTRTLEVDAGAQTFEVRRAGTENILFSNNIVLGGGKIYVAYLLGVEGAAGNAAPRIEFVELTAD